MIDRLTTSSRRAPVPDEPRRRLLVLTSSLLTDRMLAPTTVLGRLAETFDVRVLAASLSGTGDIESADQWPHDLQGCGVEPFPPVSTLRFFPAGMLQRMTDAAWDERHSPPSRFDAVRDGFPLPRRSWVYRAARIAGRAHLNLLLEQAARLAAHRRRVPSEVAADLRSWRPDLTLVTNPFHSFEPGLAAECRRQGSTVIALIPSWDNLTTKARLVFDYDGYLVLTEEQGATLRRLYPRAQHRPIHVVGTPQYDAFDAPRFQEDRRTWCARHGLDPDRKILVYALGSPNMFDEVPAVGTVASALRDGAFGDAQLLVRCHPIHDKDTLVSHIEALGESVTVQRSRNRQGAGVRERTQSLDELIDWVNTFRHADLVVNLSSTSTVDAAIFDTPVVNLDYDPAPGGRRTCLVHEVNRLWEHFAPVAQSGGLELAGTPAALVGAVRAGLADPSQRRTGRQWIVNFVAGPIDGRSGDRMAEAISSFLPTTDRNSHDAIGLTPR